MPKAGPSRRQHFCLMTWSTSYYSHNTSAFLGTYHICPYISCDIDNQVLLPCSGVSIQFGSVCCKHDFLILIFIYLFDHSIG
ncbi:rCG29638, partial [Rattus norvegicus]